MGNKYDALNEKRQQQANDIIIRRTMYAAGAGLIPVPIVDAAALLAVQMYMLRDISEVYEVPFKEEQIKSLISALAGDVAAVGLFKFIPGLGTFFGSTSVAVMGAAVTYALGQVFTKHFEKKGTFLNFDVVKEESLFKEKVEEGKKVVKGLIKNNKKEQAFHKTEATKEKSTSKASNKASNNSIANLSKQSKSLNEDIKALQKEIAALKKQRRTNADVMEAEVIVPKEESTTIDLTNLQLIKGIGPKTSKVLSDAGIDNLQDLSESTPEIVEAILEKSDGNFTLAVPDTWIIQAQIAVSNDLERLREFQQKIP